MVDKHPKVRYNSKGEQRKGSKVKKEVEWIKWTSYRERKKHIESKKEEIRRKGAKDCLNAVLLQGLGSSNPEMQEWAIAFAEYFEEHPDEWEEAKSLSSDPPKFKSFKDKIENFLELFSKVRPK